jgi:hypothetical protein
MNLQNQQAYPAKGTLSQFTPPKWGWEVGAHVRVWEARGLEDAARNISRCSAPETRQEEEEEMGEGAGVQ